MKLNADILFDELSKNLELKRLGPGKDQLTLGRPIFYESSQSLVPDRVYVAFHEQLPNQPPPVSGQLMICLGGNPPAGWQNNQTSLFVIVETRELPVVFNLLQRIYDRYDQWEADLNLILEKDADITAMVQKSTEIFGKQIVINDKNLKILAISTPKIDENENLIKVGNPISPENMEKIRSVFSELRKRTEPFFHDERKLYPDGKLIYTINLFVSDRYEGSASLFADPDRFQPGELILFQEFAGFIQKAINRQIKSLNRQVVSARRLIKDLLDRSPVDNFQLQKALELDPVKNIATSDRWICLKFRSTEPERSWPEDYLCNCLEEMLTGCISLLYDGEIVAFVHMVDEKSELPPLLTIIDPFLHSMGLQMGVSAAFQDIHSVYTHYRQACSSLETGILMHAGKTTYRFSDYTLPYILYHGKGEFTPEDLLDEGLRSIRAHDRDSSVSYWQTLRAFVDNERNVTQAARVLYVHRSTLILRLAQIYQLLGGEPATPEEWMRIRINIYMMDYSSL